MSRTAQHPHVETPPTASATAGDGRGDVLPLQLIETDDEEQMNRLFVLLRLKPLPIKLYLEETVFPSTMSFASLKISASGQVMSVIVG